jgi:hypothetical protein
MALALKRRKLLSGLLESKVKGHFHELPRLKRYAIQLEQDESQLLGKLQQVPVTIYNRQRVL